QIGGDRQGRERDHDRTQGHAEQQLVTREPILRERIPRHRREHGRTYRTHSRVNDRVQGPTEEDAVAVREHVNNVLEQAEVLAKPQHERGEQVAVVFRRGHEEPNERHDEVGHAQPHHHREQGATALLTAIWPPALCTVGRLAGRCCGRNSRLGAHCWNLLLWVLSCTTYETIMMTKPSRNAIAAA